MNSSGACLLALLVGGCWTGSTATAPAEPAGSAAPRAQPPRRPVREHSPCAVAMGPPVGATGLGTVRVELPAGETLTHMLIASQGDGGLSVTSMQMGTSLDGMATLQPGLYAIEIGTAKDQRVKCTDVRVAAGGVTTVTVELPRD